METTNDGPIDLFNFDYDDQDLELDDIDLDLLGDLGTLEEAMHDDIRHFFVLNCEDYLYIRDHQPIQMALAFNRDISQYNVFLRILDKDGVAAMPQDIIANVLRMTYHRIGDYGVTIRVLLSSAIHAKQIVAPWAPNSKVGRHYIIKPQVVLVDKHTNAIVHEAESSDIKLRIKRDGIKRIDDDWVFRTEQIHRRYLLQLASTKLMLISTELALSRQFFAHMESHPREFNLDRFRVVPGLNDNPDTAYYARFVFDELYRNGKVVTRHSLFGKPVDFLERMYANYVNPLATNDEYTQRYYFIDWGNN